MESGAATVKTGAGWDLGLPGFLRKPGRIFENLEIRFIVFTTAYTEDTEVGQRIADPLPLMTLSQLICTNRTC